MSLHIYSTGTLIVTIHKRIWYVAKICGRVV
jgi:hypothetical protein